MGNADSIFASLVSSMSKHERVVPVSNEFYSRVFGGTAYMVWSPGDQTARIFFNSCPRKHKLYKKATNLDRGTNFSTIARYAATALGDVQVGYALAALVLDAEQSLHVQYSSKGLQVCVFSGYRDDARLWFDYMARVLSSPSTLSPASIS